MVYPHYLCYNCGIFWYIDASFIPEQAISTYTPGRVLSIIRSALSPACEVLQFLAPLL